MNTSIRNLYEQILDCPEDGHLNQLLVSWINENNYVNFLNSIRQKISESIEIKITDEESWELYALSRVLDILTLRFQTNNKVDLTDWDGPNLSLDEYCEFVRQIGCEIQYPNEFSSFYCEIIEANDAAKNYSLKDVLFPAVVLGNLLIKRAGVLVGFNRNEFDLSLINNAKIYWTFRRKNRNCSDLSHDWGHNSQWRTDFRFDFETKESFIYNLYGTQNLSIQNEKLNIELQKENMRVEEAIELTMNRHFISSKIDDDDLFPFDFKYIELK